MLRNRNVRGSKLVHWLSSPCMYSSDVCEDPEYSGMYRSYFGIQSPRKIKPDDIDFKVLEQLCYDPEENEDLAEYTDLYDVQYKVSPESGEVREVNTDNAIEITILPGSNHSNANYLFKRFDEYFDQNVIIFNIPYVPPPNQKFQTIFKKFMFQFDKKSMYKFVYDMSTRDQQLNTIYKMRKIARELKKNSKRRRMPDDKTYAQLLSQNKKELSLINSVKEQMNKYIRIYQDHVKNLWDDILSPFLRSEDCTTMKFLSDEDYDTFENYMMTLPGINHVVIGLSRLCEREYILCTLHA